MSLRDIAIENLLCQRASDTPNAIALKDDYYTYTWHELYDKARQYGEYFLSRGITSGDRVLLVGKNRVEWVFSFYGIILIGAIPVPCNPYYRTTELEYILELMDSKFVVYDHQTTIDEACVTLMRSKKDYSFIRMYDPKRLPKVKEHYPLEENLNRDSREIACILLTSGTTGRPKGVQLTHYNLVNNACGIAESMGWQISDRMLLSVPLFHCFGITQAMLSSVCKGFELFIIPEFRSRRILEVVEQEKITILSGVPSMFSIILCHNILTHYNLESIQSGIIAGSALGPSEYDVFSQAFQYKKLAQSYGQTETSPAATITDFRLDKSLWRESVGIPLENTKVRIVDQQENVLETGKIGLIQVQGYNVMLGYIGKNERYDENSWWTTGDMGFFDELGCLHVSGRKKDIIIRGGENISAVEIENTVKELSCINDARALAVSDELMGEEIALFVSICSNEIVCRTDVSVAMIRSYLNKRLARYKIPKYFKILDQLPRNTTGKINDNKLLKLFKEEKMSKKLLEGVKVVELASFIAAATAGRFLADLGADVIKVEAAKGDPLRYTAPSEGRPLDMYENTTWELENANKRCISINTKDPEGKEVLMKLLSEADILITNWRDKALKKNGLDYETLKEKFPKLVYGMCTGYGTKGPDVNLPGFDFTSFFARGGYLEALRQKGSRPMNVCPGLGDHNVGMNLAAGLLAALYHAKETGEGEFVEVSLFSTAVFNMGMMVQAAQYKDYGKPYPIDITDADNPFNAAFETKEGRYIQVCCPDYNTYYKRFMTALGREDLVENENYFPVKTMQEKGLNTEVFNIVQEAFRKKTVDEWYPILTEADMAFSLAQSWEEILEDEQAWACDMLYTMKYDNGNERTLVRLPVHFEEMGVPEYNRGPFIGEHGPEILKELGYEDETIERLQETGGLYVWKDEK